MSVAESTNSLQHPLYFFRPCRRLNSGAIPQERTIQDGRSPALLNVFSGPRPLRSRAYVLGANNWKGYAEDAALTRLAFYIDQATVSETNVLDDRQT